MSNARLNRWLLAMLLTVFGATAGAAEAQPTAVDPALEARVMAIAAELRCLVCQNQTIADSSAELAVDLRRQVREMLQQGKSQHDILEFMTARYGDFVLYRPPLKNSTALLWLGLHVRSLDSVHRCLLRAAMISQKRRLMMTHAAFEADASVGTPYPAIKSSTTL